MFEFAFRYAKQHLGLNDGQARSQAKLHFHFSMVFAALFWARLQARLRAEDPLGPFSPRNLKRHNFEEEIHKRTKELAHGWPRAETPPIPKPAAVASPRNASGCGHPLVNRGRPLNAGLGPDRHTGSGLKMCPNHG